MDVKFTESFFKSLKRLNRQQSWWYKTYELFRYKIPYFVENIWYFKKELWEHRSWDYIFSLMMLRRSLTKLAHTLEFYGWEVDESRLKKVAEIKRAIYLIDRIREKSYVEAAEEELGELKNTDWFEMDRMRKLIADHMVMSKQTSPHVTSYVEADVTNLVMWRDKVKKSFEKREGEKITFTPVFINRCLS